MMSHLINKLYNEHRTAYAEIVDIEKSEESAEVKNKRILKIFNEELLPHFKQEEDELFTDDFGSKYFIKEHKMIYELIEKIKRDKSGKYITSFCSIMKDHIVSEDEYFRALNKENNVKGYFIIAILSFLAGVLLCKMIRN